MTDDLMSGAIGGVVNVHWNEIGVICLRRQFQIVKNSKEIVFVPNWYKVCLLSVYHLRVKTKKIKNSNHRKNSTSKLQTIENHQSLVGATNTITSQDTTQKGL